MCLFRGPTVAQLVQAILEGRSDCLKDASVKCTVHCPKVSAVERAIRDIYAVSKGPLILQRPP